MLTINELKHSRFPVAAGNEWPMAVSTERTAAKPPNGLEWPKISIITPSFNQGPYLEKTIRSVLLQGYPNLEYIVIDGGSTDQSVEIIRKYEQWIDFWVSEKDRGQSHAINKGLEKATGDLLGWLNSDDYFLPGTLFKLALAHLEDPAAGAIYGQGHIVDEQGVVVHIPKLVPVTRESLFGWCFGNDFMQPSCLFTRQAWQETGWIDESLNFTLDVDLWIRIADKFPFKQIADLLSISLSHPLAKTASMRNRSHAELALLCMRYGEELDAKRILDSILSRQDVTEKQLRRYQNMTALQILALALRRLITSRV